MSRNPLRATALSIGLTALFTSPAALAADGLTPAQQLALEAVTLEFARHGVTAAPQVLEERFKAACDRGYGPACSRRSWLRGGEPDLQAAGSVFASPCDKGDPIACLVRGWAHEDDANTKDVDDERNSTYTSAARLFKLHCEHGFVPACHEYG